MNNLTNPWAKRKELGFLKALAQTIGMVLLKPKEFFSWLQTEAPLWEPYLFYLVVSLITGTISLIVTKFVDKTYAKINFLLALGMFFLLTVGLIFVSAAFIHLCVRLFKGQGKYKATFNVLAYASAASIFNIIPFVGGYIAGIWAIVVVIIGLKRMHNFSTFRAFLTYLALPLLAIIFILAAIAIPNITKAKIGVNEAHAKANIVMLSSAIEIYRADNDGKFPLAEDDLRNKNKPYLDKPFHNTASFGYRYSLEFSADGYKILAVPERCNESGRRIFSKTNSQELKVEACK